ncbi:DNA -binding domain-containing protein [Sphingomonas sp.]|uniref:DNA -binding domain-containing protein n=1 Tax=Sphingomonas sp. TaxID=28214 RepID=UPI003B002836
MVDQWGEYVVLSDGLRRIRIDVAGGYLGHEPVLLVYAIEGSRSAISKVLPLRRAIEITARRRFPIRLFAPEPRAQRALTLLRVHDALADGATHRQIAAALFGEDRARLAWNGTSDSLRSQVRRLVAAARALSLGGYQKLLDLQARKVSVSTDEASSSDQNHWS